MLEPEFENIQRARAEHNNKLKARVEYSGGFRQLSSSHLRNNDNQISKNQSDVEFSQSTLDYIYQLGVQNLPNCYLKILPDNSGLLFEKQKQQQQQSVVRLYRNLYPGRKSRAVEQVEENQESEDKKYAEDVWSMDKKFEQLPNEFILQKQIERMDRKISIQFEGAKKRNKIGNEATLNQVFGCFIMKQYNAILEVYKKNSKIDNQLQIVFIWKGFLHTTNHKKVMQQLGKQKISHLKIQELRRISKYCFCRIKLPQIKQDEKGNKFYSLQELSNCINKNLKLQMKQIKEHFQITKQYTNPFKIEEQASKSSRKKQNLGIQKVHPEQDYYQFKANPVPKSMYMEKKQKQKHQTKTTQVKPFKITEKQQMMTAEQFYQFEKGRDFKAQGVPQTTYKPFKPALLSQQQKKARALMSLQKSKYPNTMQNLQNYNGYLKERTQQLTEKYEKMVSKIPIHQIPDFNHLHAKQLVSLQTKKQMNSKSIKIQPFKLSLTRGKPGAIIQNPNFGVPLVNPYIPPTKPAKEVKSTKKFETYVKFRSESQKQKTRKEQEEQKKKRVKQEHKEPYRNIIKERMAQQFEKHPRKSNQYDASMPRRMVVDKAKIYKEKPLLMQSSLPAQQYNLGWDPIF